VAFSTDIIVGFPGETEEDFAHTLEVVEEARFDSAFTFQYSPRPGTAAAAMPDQVPAEVVAERFQRLVALQERIALERNRALVGSEVELLVEQASSKTDPTRMSGRTRTNKLCHFPAPTSGSAPDPRTAQGPMPVVESDPRTVQAPTSGRAGHPRSELSGVVVVVPGDLVTVRVEHAAPHHLLAGPVLSHRPRPVPASSCAIAPPPRPLPAGAVPLPLVG
jgi:tRNA-2-methylthio-N6-dimethylallyladenosine synthase